MNELPERRIEFSPAELEEILRRCKALSGQHVQILKAVCELKYSIPKIEKKLQLSTSNLKKLLGQIYQILQIRQGFAGSKFEILIKLWPSIKQKLASN